MSEDIAARSCPTAVVNKQKKKTVADMDRESSADIALYAVVDETEVSCHKNYDENDYSNVEAEYTDLCATREEVAQPTLF